MAIQYIKGDATQPTGKGPQIIAHVCNDIGGWGKGFVLALSKRWKAPENEYRAWSKRPTPELPFKLGEVQFVEVQPNLWVANMIVQKDITRAASPSNTPPVRYEAIETALGKVAKFAVEKGATVNMPRIGCGLAGGKWERIEPLITNTLIAADVEVVVYDFG